MNQYILMLIIIVIIAVISLNNSIEDLKKRSENCWEQMISDLDKRLDCTYKAFNIIKSDNSAQMESIEEAAEKIRKSVDIYERKEGEKLLNSVIRNMYVLVQKNDKLQHNMELEQLVNEIRNLKDKINNSAEFYNDLADKYNKKIETFPTSITAAVLKLKKIDNFNCDTY